MWREAKMWAECLVMLLVWQAQTDHILVAEVDCITSLHFS